MPHVRVVSPAALTGLADVDLLRPRARSLSDIGVIHLTSHRTGSVIVVPRNPIAAAAQAIYVQVVTINRPRSVIT